MQIRCVSEVRHVHPGGLHLLKVQILLLQLRDVLALRLQSGTYVGRQSATAAAGIAPVIRAAAIILLGVQAAAAVAHQRAHQALVGAKEIQLRSCAAASAVLEGVGACAAYTSWQLVEAAGSCGGLPEPAIARTASEGLKAP